MDEQRDTGLDRVEPGWDVYGSDDEKIGSIDAVNASSMSVEKGGIFFVKDLYVPAAAIGEVDPEQRRVTLNVTKDAVDDMGWTQPAIHEPGEARETWGQGTIEADASPDPLLTRETVLDEGETADVKPGPTTERLL